MLTPLIDIPPWEALPYFEQPKVTPVAIPGSGFVVAAKANPLRWGLVFVESDASTTSLAPGEAQPPAGASFAISQSNSLQVMYPVWGPIASMAWSAAILSGAGTIGVWEFLLTSWPHPDGISKLAAMNRRFASTKPPPNLGAPSGPNGRNRLLDWWKKLTGRA